MRLCSEVGISQSRVSEGELVGNILLAGSTEGSVTHIADRMKKERTPRSRAPSRDRRAEEPREDLDVCVLCQK